MRESDRVRGWFQDREKMEELARRCFEKRHPDEEWDELFLSEKGLWEMKARRILQKTLAVVENSEDLRDENFTADDLIKIWDRDAI